MKDVSQTPRVAFATSQYHHPLYLQPRCPRVDGRRDDPSEEHHSRGRPCELATGALHRLARSSPHPSVSMSSSASSVCNCRACKETRGDRDILLTPAPRVFVSACRALYDPNTARAPLDASSNSLCSLRLPAALLAQECYPARASYSTSDADGLTFNVCSPMLRRTPRRL